MPPKAHQLAGKSEKLDFHTIHFETIAMRIPIFQWLRFYEWNFKHRRASTIVNRILITLIVVASLAFLFLRASPKFSEADRACIQEEWQENKSLNVSSEINNETYQIVFADVQKEFKWIFLPKEISGNPDILMIVSSNRDNFARRNVIRKSWMNSDKNKIVAEKRMKILFLVGVNSENEKENTVVLKEAQLFGDMIVVDLEDTYRNLPYKSLTILLYGQSKAAESVKLIGKIDEDVIFYPDQLTPLINDGTINMSISTIYGNKRNAGVEVVNKKTSKWFIPTSSFKCPLFPSYLYGPFYLTTRKAAERILKSTKHRKFISVCKFALLIIVFFLKILNFSKQAEDALISGLLAGDVGVEKKHLLFIHMCDELTTDTEILAWHNSRNNAEFLESWENLRLSRCKACRKSRNFRGSRSQLDEERNQ
ncbi:Protein CBR-BRE-2.2 [Caenorhabditis briggsae]|uniref:Hexosyltransferase n=1 Tax=Caenorhabditis briggsae TaxID=6238 RepID=A8Y3H4_CAEBR|nr:Protein CBR-BRE-2.2 [Caenorhabditis briggsae]CAP39443.1 Protein CBR-BRE-2.2 [Caenorhabditis briggsae]